MPSIRVDCQTILMALNISSKQCDFDFNDTGQPSNSSISDASADSEGAMKFTIAVVLVYGVGVIGLLGITARRNRRLEMMDKEVNKYLKNRHCSPFDMQQRSKRNKKPRVLFSLLSAIHSQTQTSPSNGSSTNAPRPFSEKRSFTWAGQLSEMAILKPTNSKPRPSLDNWLRPLQAELPSQLSSQHPELTCSKNSAGFTGELAASDGRTTENHLDFAAKTSAQRSCPCTGIASSCTETILPASLGNSTEAHAVDVELQSPVSEMARDDLNAENDCLLHDDLAFIDEESPESGRKLFFL